MEGGVELVSFSAGVASEQLVSDDPSDVDSESDLIARIPPNREEGDTDEDASKAGGNQLRLKRELSYFSGLGYVIGGIIGSGIFVTPSTILCRTGSFGISMLVWVIGGVVALSGGLCYIELGLLIRKSGGDYSYIKEIYSFKKSNRISVVLGSLLSFLFVWGSVFVLRASSLAIITLTCAEYFIKPLFIECEDIPRNAVKLLSISILSMLCYSIRVCIVDFKVMP